ncbi:MULTISPECIES: ribose-phosphate diphosphokinase [Dethiosulfovibrio]|uniref:Ribose-phosphate pyrophosphokinase n=2 Tax=Dethiosulfovibrio TaxID=47054 RepID=A0ABS9EQ92_9BACT|nr:MULTISPECIES: ribose-phosphate pyrophosphokinase [Dethiosulfovibrio]MCF4115047.1 ribose-phosphate pyrophosphokinase [Dethiosulfovibrio russensis]MCF4143369.1 ribose-phosphate pyrophosphokinase [Dethiosulfovibrio marinus]MCF4145512.1 ribose-phosphate pyrophosphokinase [Dethiosulfovibrio acidaminovorans]
MSNSSRKLMIFSGTAHRAFADKICSELDVPLCRASHFRFSDGEIGLSIEESVRGADVFVVQPTCYPVNENLMELLIMVDALKRASAYRINLVIPYFGYARQDRKTKARDPISGKLVANLLETAGAHRVISADLHAGQIQGFFDIPVDHLMGVPLLASYFKKQLAGDLEDRKVTVVAPDVGGVVRARKFAVLLNSDLAIVDKRRSHEVANYCEVMAVIGDVSGKVAILVDDIIDTAGTIVNAAKALKERGASKVYCCATHGILSGPAVERLASDEVDGVILTDSIKLPDERKLDKITQLSIAPLFAEAIRRVHVDSSVSSLFD